MKIRIEGNPYEIRDIQRLLAKGTANTNIVITSISEFYPNRSNANNGRVYIDLAYTQVPTQEQLNKDLMKLIG